MFDAKGAFSFKESAPTFRVIQILTSIRQSYSVLRRGVQIIRWSDPDGPGIFAFSRVFGNEEVIIVMNTARVIKTITFYLDTQNISIASELIDLLDGSYVTRTEDTGCAVETMQSITVEVPEPSEKSFGIRILAVIENHIALMRGDR